MIAEQYKNRYFINGINLYDTYGVIVEKGGYDELMKEPKRKQGYTHVWLENNGTERDIINYFETRNVTLIFTFVCTTLADYQDKHYALFNFMKNNKFFIQSNTLAKQWELLYDSETSVEYLTDIYAGGLVIAKHTLSFFNDSVFSTPFTPITI